MKFDAGICCLTVSIVDLLCCFCSVVCTREILRLFLVYDEMLFCENRTRSWRRDSFFQRQHKLCFITISSFRSSGCLISTSYVVKY